MNILVTAIGAFAADIVIKTLRAKHHHVIGCDILPKAWIADAYNVDHFVQAPRLTEREAYINFIKTVCEQYAVQYIMPLTDPEIDVICEMKDELQARGVCACVSDLAVTRLCRDKYMLSKYLEQFNLCPVIPARLLADADQASLGFPLLAKQRYGRSSQGMMVIKSQIGYGFISDLAKETEYIIQPYIAGNVINVDLVRSPDDKVFCVARRDLLRHPSGAGTTVEIIKNDWLTGTCAKIANLLGIIGAANFEFIESPEQMHFMEINPRFSGGIEFSHMAGYDVVSNHLRCFTGENIETDVNVKKMIIARKYEEYVTEVLEV